MVAGQEVDELMGAATLQVGVGGGGTGRERPGGQEVDELMGRPHCR